MSNLVVLASDGSELSIAALQAGVALLAPDTRYAIVTVMHEPDPMLVSGAGFAGGVATPEEADALAKAESQSANEALAETEAALGLTNAESQVLRGEPASAICTFAKDRSAAAVVIGSRGRGGLKRALLGSVSDYIVRHAPCPVIVTAPRDESHPKS
jgi:nucleotide-binding universal stress UspA family protein